MAHSSDWVKKLPNILTGFRIFLVPIFVILMLNPTEERMLWSAAVFLFASLTDWLDGYLARLYQAESILGKLLDPLADKVLVLAALVMLCATPGEPRVQAWIVVVLLSREFLVSGLRSLAAVKGNVVAASYWAKHKTAWTLISIVCLLLDRSYQILGFTVDFHSIGTILLWVAMFFSLFSGFQYAVRLRRII